MTEKPEAEETVRTIRRREARSKRLSYADPVVVYDSRQRLVKMVPFFISRTEGTDLAVKIVTYQKRDDGFIEIEQKSVSLPEAGARNLLKALRDHLQLAEEDANGNYVLLKVADGGVQLGEHDAESIVTALAKAMSQPEIVEHLEGTELSTELIGAFRTAIRLNEMRSAVTQLRSHLEADITEESVYQDWCENHSWAFGNAYVMRDDVRNISAGDKLDLLLPSVITGFRDIVELKRPNDDVVLYDSGHRNYYFAAPVSKAIGQCHRYLDVLHDEAATGLRDHPDVLAYHPRAIIVIGRSSDWDDDRLKALHGLSRRLSGISVMTYDMLLAQGERLVQVLSTERGQDRDNEADALDDVIAEIEASGTVEIDDDDLPF